MPSKRFDIGDMIRYQNSNLEYEYYVVIDTEYGIGYDKWDAHQLFCLTTQEFKIIGFDTYFMNHSKKVA